MVFLQWDVTSSALPRSLRGNVTPVRLARRIASRRPGLHNFEPMRNYLNREHALGLIDGPCSSGNIHELGNGESFVTLLV
jgi:hypothetical protein